MDWIEPMSPILIPSVAEGEAFIHQVKWDGIRGLCYIENGKLRIFTKRGRDRTHFYPELKELPALLKTKQAVLDGEIIILNEEMRPSFHLSLIRERVSDVKKVPYYARKYPVQYIVFDLLALNDERITTKPLHERSILLRENLRTGSNTAITDDFEDGNELFNLMKQKGWEGIVSKKKNSLYLPGKTHQDWFKTKLSRRILAIITGLATREGVPNALVLAIMGEEGLTYIGKASLGLTQEHFRLLTENLPALESKNKPINSNSSEFKGVIWLKPQLTVWVSFLEWTSDGSLRHPKILGFTDLSPEEADGREYME